METVSILGFENCQSFFLPLSRYDAQHLPGRHRAADVVRHIPYFIGETTNATITRLQYANNFFK